jgi:hypothetical protein
MGTLYVKKEFRYKYNFSFYKEFLWRTGDLSSYWYQVVGCCKNTNTNDSCPPFKTDDTGCNNKKSFYFQTLLASSVEDVCQQLIANNWDWELCSVKKWSKPAENAYISFPEDDCNILQEVDFKNISECISLSVSQKPFINIKFNMTIEESTVIPVYVSSGGISLEEDSKTTYSHTTNSSFFNEDYLKYKQNNKDKLKLIKKIEAAAAQIPDSSESLDQLTTTIPTVIVNCSQCTTLSSRLYCTNNLINLGNFSNFIYKSNQKFDSNFNLIYSKNSDSWNKNFYYESKNDSNDIVKWYISFDLSCISRSELEYYWKFLIIFKKLENGIVSDSKLNIEVPSEFVCGYNSEFIFNFNYNVVKKYLFTNINYFRDDFVFYDKIGLFSNNYWYNNPEIYIKITENYDPSLITRKRIVY